MQSSDALKQTSLTAKYSAEHARRRFLQMPLVSIRIGDPMKGHLFSILMETFSGMDYSKIGIILSHLDLLAQRALLKRV